MEENRGEETAYQNKDNPKEISNINENNEELPEPEITEEEMKNIINYINTWDYEKYKRDSEIREALLLLKNKMNQEELEKDKQLNELKRKENIIFETNINKDTNDNNNYNESIKNYFEEEKIEGDNKYYTKYIENNNNNVFRDELSEKEKEYLEKNWNRSTRPEFGEKIVNVKGDKEIIIYNNDEKKEKEKEKEKKVIHYI